MTIEDSHNSDLALGHRLADAAAVVSLSYFRRELRGWSKADGSLATEADVAVEDELRARLRVERPSDAVLGEERGETGSGARRWIIDGIDGSVDFATGTPDWGTLIALEVDGHVVIGVCDQPAHGRRYWAAKGGGAFASSASLQSPRSLSVSTIGDLRAARSYLPPAKWLPDEQAHAVADTLATATKPEPHIDHPALQVAAGGYELAVFLLAGPWDLAAPALIVEEAGGRFTDLRGRNDLTSGTAVFTNGLLHDDVLRLVEPVVGMSSHRLPG
jgi:histidinol-phosphatase